MAGAIRRDDTARTLLATVEQLAEQLHADAAAGMTFRRSASFRRAAVPKCSTSTA
jgi:hypothetical protein